MYLRSDWRDVNDLVVSEATDRPTTPCARTLQDRPGPVGDGNTVKVVSAPVVAAKDAVASTNVEGLDDAGQHSAGQCSLAQQRDHLERRTGRFAPLVGLVRQ